MKKRTLITEKVYSFDIEYQGLVFNFEDRNLNIYRYATAGGTSPMSVFNPLGLVVTYHNTLFLRTKVKKGFGKGRTRVVKCKLL